MHLIRKLLLVLWLVASPWVSIAAAQQGSPNVAKQYSIEDFFRNAQYAGVQLSPNGQYLAAVVPHKERRNLAVIDLKARSVALVTSLQDRDVNAFWWISANRLAFNLIDLQSPAGEQRGAGLFAVDRDGRNGRELSPISSITATSVARYRWSRFLAAVGDYEDKESDDILVLSNERNLRFTDVYRVDTRTGRRTLLTFQSPGDVVDWTLDRTGSPRAAVVDNDNGEYSVFMRASEKDAWRKLGTFHAYKDDPAAFAPVAFDHDGTLIVRARGGGDKEGLFKYDIAANKLGEKLVGHKDYDLLGDPLRPASSGGLIFDPTKKGLVGVMIEADRREFVWFDAQWASWQKMIDQTLPHAVNELVRPRGSPFVLVRSYSDRQPGEWLLFDPEKRNLERVIASRPWIDPAQMAERKFIRYRARDGLEIPAYLTLPRGGPAKGLPLVVDVHGGPYVRGHVWGFSAEAQFLASRGYAVLQPDFRGSLGYGRKHFEAGWKQWGRAMQDDINDGVQHLVQQGIADPAKVCIYGGSYGGYAVMMGLARDPDLWRCGVNIVGVTDLDLFESATWSDYGSDWRDSTQAFFDTLIGGRKADPERWEQTSPVRHAAKIKRPVLMAYGGLDQRVPIQHGERMRSALRSAGVPHEYVVYETEGHGFLLEKNRFDFYSRVEKFLAEQLK